jgi:hypothetical protein
MTDIFARSLVSKEVACRNTNGWHLGPLLGDPTKRRIDDFLRPLVQAVAGAAFALVPASVAHTEGIIPISDAAQQIRQVDEALSNEMGHAALSLVAAADRHHP